MKSILIGFMIMILLLATGCAIQSNSANLQRDENSTLIPREVFFGSVDRDYVTISPDGSKISYLAPVNGVLNVWVGSASNPESVKPVTNSTGRGILMHLWAYTNEHILYLQDKNGDENLQIYSLNLTSNTIKNLTPFEDVRAVPFLLSYKNPLDLIIGLNKRDPQYFDIYKADIETGNYTLVMENREFTGFDIDNNFRIRLASKTLQDGGKEIFKLTERGWESFLKIRMEDVVSTTTRGFDKTGQAIYMVDSRDRNTAALYAINLSTGNKSLIAEDPLADISDFLIHPIERNVQAVAFSYSRTQWKIIDPSIAVDLEYLHKAEDGDMMVSRSLNDNVWIVAYIVDDGPKRYYHYDRDRKEAKYLFADREKLQDKTLAKMIPVIIKSRDGLDMVSYYSLPLDSDTDGNAIPNKPLPMVLLVHGGPYARDEWGYNPEHQWLANRGYAVLSVNFRGSTGFGKNYSNAGNLEWGGKMQEDLIDAVNWAIQKGIANPRKVAIMGESYGGYATLTALALTPDVFSCGVDIAGPTNLIALLETMPPYWKTDVELFTTRIGDFRTEDGRELLGARSPLSHVDKIHRPLLIYQGANDPRVKSDEVDQMVQAMQKKNLPVTYVIYPDEGHDLVRQENRLAFYAITEVFLSHHLGGRCEPIGNDLLNSSIKIQVGVDEIPGLKDALSSKRQLDQEQLN